MLGLLEPTGGEVWSTASLGQIGPRVYREKSATVMQEINCCQIYCRQYLAF